MRLRPWLTVEAICSQPLSTKIQGRIKDLVALKFKVHNSQLRTLAAEESHARILTTLRPGRKLHPGAWGFSDCTPKNQIARTLCFVQGVQPDCAAHLGKCPACYFVLKSACKCPRSMLQPEIEERTPVGLNLDQRGKTRKMAIGLARHQASHSCAIKSDAGKNEHPARSHHFAKSRRSRAVGFLDLRAQKDFYCRRIGSRPTCSTEIFLTGPIPVW
jgi:hypothetical protein